MNRSLLKKPLYIFVIFVVTTILVILVFAKQKANDTSTQSPTPRINSDTKIPQITSPKDLKSVSSPLTITGIVPAGWMFEGSFPVKLFTNSGKLIAETTAHEITAGDWQTGGSVKFSATLTFKVNESLGKLRLMKDNPSGLPENNVSYEIPVTFKTLK